MGGSAPEDEYQKRPCGTYNSVLTWRALLGIAALFDRMKEPEQARKLRSMQQN
jgi:hypothetical protein